MTVLAIDPGSERSAWVLWDGNRVVNHDIRLNAGLLACLRYDTFADSPTVVIEWIASYGMAVGAEVFDTARWIGRFEQAAQENRLDVQTMFRREVKLHLCGQARAKDANIRQALIDRFGGKEKAIGRKSSQGPLYGVTGDCWQALALGITWWDLNGSIAREALKGTEACSTRN